MTFYDFITNEYWGIPLWGWICLVLGLFLILGAIQAASSAKKAEVKDVTESTDVEAAEVNLPQAHPPASPPPAQIFPRDGSLPPIAPSETSKNGSIKPPLSNN